MAVVAAIPNIRHIVLPLYATPEQTLTFGEMCPCGSGKPETQCCGPYLAGAPAPTAVALMRSRYTAYVRGAIDYLVATHDASTRDTVDVKAVTKWSRQTLWLGLEIVSTQRGGAKDDDGVVEFIARGSTLGRPFEQRERSRFRRVEGRWYYIDGDVR